MINKKFLIAAVASACLFFASVAMLCVSVAKTNRQTDLGFDLRQYTVSKMYTDNETTRIAGTQNGEIFAFDTHGEIQWNAGQIYERAVYDIIQHNGEVYAAYANGRVVRFPVSAAEAFTDAGATEEAQSAFRAQVREYYAGYSFNSGGNVKNTQLAVSPDGESLFLRGMFNDTSRVNRIYRFELSGGGSHLETGTSATLGGMAVDEDGTLWWSTQSAIWRRSGDARETYADANETLQAISVYDGNIYAVSGSNKLYRISTQDVTDTSVWELKTEFATGFVFSTGKNFVAKINNGGVAVIDTQKHKVTLSMNAADSANLVMWTDDSFVLRDESDITNPQVIYYSMSLAKSIALFAVLRWVFVALMLVLLLSTLYLGFATFDDFRERIHKKARAFFRALWRYKFIYLSLAIPFLLLILFYYIPIGFGFGLSFFDYIPGTRSVFVGFRNFVAVLASAQFWKSAGMMLVFLLADILKALIPPVLLAEAIMAVRSKRFSLWVRILLFVPGIMPGVATTLVWSAGIFGATPNSLVNAFLGLFMPGFVKNWVYSASLSTSMGTLIAFGFPWIGSYLIFYGAISGINASVFEASRLDGCGWFRRIVKIDIPLILPQLKYIFVTSFIASVQNYTNIYVLHGINGQIQTPALLMYREIINANYGVASVMGVLIFLFLSVATFFNFRMQSDKS